MRRRSSPFVMPAQPRPTTVSILWPWSTAARSSGICSSRRTRPSQQRSAREIERRDRLVASHGWELAKKLTKGFAAFEVIEQGLYRHACADEHRRAIQDVRVAVHDLAQLRHGDCLRCPLEYTHGRADPRSAEPMIWTMSRIVGSVRIFSSSLGGTMRVSPGSIVRTFVKLEIAEPSAFTMCVSFLSASFEKPPTRLM